MSTQEVLKKQRETRRNRLLHGLCYVCGKKLPKKDAHTNCVECRKKARDKYRKYAQKKETSKGYRHTQAFRDAISRGQKARWTKQKGKERVMSEEQKKAISKGQKKHWAEKKKGDIGSVEQGIELIKEGLKLKKERLLNEKHQIETSIEKIEKTLIIIEENLQ